MKLKNMKNFSSAAFPMTDFPLIDDKTGRSMLDSRFADIERRLESLEQKNREEIAHQAAMNPGY